jgi:hypothetical protein
MDYEGELHGRTPVEILLDMLRAYLPDIDFGDVAMPRRRRATRQRTAARAEEPRNGRRRGAESDHRDRARPGGEPETLPPPGRKPDPVLVRCYAELGIPYGADFQQVRGAWRRLMRQHHPDVQGEDAERRRIGTEQAKRFNNAFAEIARWLRGGQGDTTNA